MFELPGVPLSELKESFSRITVYPGQRNVAEVCFRDGRCARMVLGEEISDSSLREITYNFDSDAILIVTGRGEVLDIDPRVNLGSPGVCPVVYLDQGHWSTLSKRMYGTTGLRESDIAAADALIELAKSRRIILPMSAGHALETSALFNAKRQDLACTIFQLSRGWQMRNPVRVRKYEMAKVLSGSAGRRTDVTESEVFSTAPGVMDLKRPVGPPGDGQPTIADLHFVMTILSGMYDVLLSPVRVESVKAVGWCEYYNNIIGDQAFLSRRREQRRTDALAISLVDVGAEALEVANSLGVSDPEYVTTALYENLQGMPFLSLYADVVDFRLSNRSRWVPNDLVDMLFLGCASAYADVVIAEKAATNYLTRSWRDRGGSSPVVATLPEGVEALQRVL
ncbi:hypothetical protein [Streptomyces umbrinus]|uniref:hypothetical protein n=1 Tax=Streptomyces umbrinus TaxID=67370 RepID=UPI0033D331E1